ncbi:MAG: peptidoglycan DD-metalloendopeptidase family protein [Pseudomonadota bacterium]
MTAVALASGCANPNLRAPVEDRMVGASRPVLAAELPSSPPVVSTATPSSVATPLPVESTPSRVLPGAENAGKPGYYTVKPGETLIRVGLESGQNWKDIAKWNNIDNINVIEAGQVLRVVPPGTDLSPGSRPVSSAKVDARPLEVKPAVAAAPTPVAPVTMPPPPPPIPTPAPSDSVAAASPSTGMGATPAREDENVQWMWPSAGAVASTFDEGKNKGVTLNGKLGDPVLASADGRVVYAGSGLRGYGNLVILKHNNTYLTAYAHNQALLVKEDQTVKRGQKIAEMGSTDADRVQLHFEIRKQGRPIDPLKLLPTR